MNTEAQVICAVQEKGGAGKTGILCALAALMAEDGARVLIVDTDPQKSATRWAEKPATEPLGIDYAYCDKEDSIVDSVRGVLQKYDVVFIDTAGVKYRMVDYVVQLSDLVLVPCKASEDDLMGLLRSLKTIKSVSSLSKRQIPYVVIKSDIDKDTNMTNVIEDSLTEARLPMMGECIPHRTSWKEFKINGGGPQGPARQIARKLLGEFQVKKMLNYYESADDQGGTHQSRTDFGSPAAAE